MICIVQRCRILDGQHCFIFFHSLHRFLSMRSPNRFWSHILVIQETICGLGRSLASTRLWNTSFWLCCNIARYLDKSRRRAVCLQNQLFLVPLVPKYPHLLFLLVLRRPYLPPLSFFYPPSFHFSSFIVN